MFLLVLLIGLLLTGCEMGMGPTIDLEAPALTVKSIVMPDGQSKAVNDEENEKLLIGPWILVTSGFTLAGEAWDNVRIEEILVEEIDADSQVIQSWTSREIGERTSDGNQPWTITLDNIGRGERTLRVTAYDRPKNIGPNTIRQITLLVDVDPPFIEKIEIERHEGLYRASLLSRAALEKLDINNYEHVDYFQNEQFDIRAAIAHDFSLSSVTLNLVDKDGKPLFGNGLAPASGSLYAPLWHITAADIIKAGSAYATGRHYFSVEITARALAGHTGQNGGAEEEDKTNLLFSLCWYPEADRPRVQLTGNDGTNLVEKGGVLPIKVFDDDNVGEVYAALFEKTTWDGLSGGSDNAKLDALIAGGRNNFISLQSNRLTNLTRNTVITVDADENQGEYRLIVLLRDVNENAEAVGLWSSAVYKVQIIEEGIPVITVEGPAENSSPALVNNRFTITGKVMNLDEVKFLKIAWIPNVPNWDTQKQNDEGQNALINNSPNNGIRVWDIPLTEGTPTPIGGKVLRQYAFSHSFNIFSDFTYNSDSARDAKFFILYTQSIGSIISDGIDVFKSYRLGTYTTPPTIAVGSPNDFQDFAPGGAIPFSITVTSQSGVPITAVELTRLSPNSGTVALTRTGNSNVWTGSDSHTAIGDYGYNVTARDQLGNEDKREIYIKVTSLPNLMQITSPHANGLTFSANTTDRANIVRVYMVFERAVEVTIPNTATPPRLVLGGITNGSGGAAVERYATYVEGSNSTTLIFEYAVQNNDFTSGNLSAASLDLRGATIAGIYTNFNSVSVNQLAAKALKVDGVAPTISSITFVNDTGLEYSPWHKAGNELTINVVTSKVVRVLGNPKLNLPFNNRQASFQTMTSAANSSTLTFTYIVQSGDQSATTEAAAAISLSGTYLSTTDRQTITDTVGTQGNYLTLGSPTQTGNAKVDAVAPNALTVTQNGTAFAIANTNREPDASRRSVEYTVDGINWVTTTNWAINTPTALGRYPIAARQTDLAGNVSPLSNSIVYTVNPASNLTTLTCLNANGAYSGVKSPADTLTFRLNFSGKVYTSGSAATITVTDGANGNTGVGGTREVTFTQRTKAQADFYLEAVWNIPTGIVFDPLVVQSININNVLSDVGDAPISTTTVDAVRDAYNTSRGTYSANTPYLKVISRAPTITDMLGSGTFTIQVLAPTNSQSVLRLTFNQTVWPESGTITIKPYGDWHIPPVLTSADYNTVNNALSGNNKTWLNNAYIRTTHGLMLSGSSYVPDTSTKYVLDFNTGIVEVENATAHNTAVAALRTAFNAAKYQWQEIEVRLNSDKIRGEDSNGVVADLTATNGSRIILVYLDQLPPGRQWKVEIPAGAFRDEAGNTFAGWLPASTNRFWSQTVATPVIRVNRVSNNLPTPTDATAQLDNTARTFNATTGAVTTTLGLASEQIFRTDVQYRIDCETPYATITRNTYNKGTATITNAMTSQTQYAARTDVNGNQNSSIDDATAANLTGININQAYNTMGEILTIGAVDTEANRLYTARKDYIAARATLTANPPTNPALTASGRGYEGAFKTVIVYRNVSFSTTNLANRYVKYEGANVEGAATTIDGFPLTNNDMTGKTSKYAYRNPNPVTVNGTANNDNIDWIWITWEIVCNSWIPGLSSDNATPNSLLQTSAWNAQGEPVADWGIHTGRKYGNYGLRVGGGDNNRF